MKNKLVSSKLYIQCLLLFVWMMAFVVKAVAQTDSMVQNHQPEMATTMRSNGKIYVVVAVLVIILTGLFLYVIRLDRKISRLEKTKPDA